ncbi:MAG: N-acetylglucosamine kinase [Plesiomonas sp.]
MYYGFDIGGTKIEFGAFDTDLVRVMRERVTTPSDSYDDFLATIVNLVRAADAKLGAEGKIGIGIPGIADVDTGKLLTSNIPAAMGQTLKHDLEALLDREVRIENDANCFALSEAWDDDLREYPSVLGLILGTGVGGGIVINGKVHAGRANIAGEVGHIRLPYDALKLLGMENAPIFSCGCKKMGCIDNYLSGRGFELLYAHYFAEKLSAQEIIEHYYAGERRALQHVDRFMDLLAICLGNILTALDPHVVVIGGGLSNFALIYEELPKRLPEHLLNVAKVPRIIKARHGDAGGVRGAAFLHLS